MAITKPHHHHHHDHHHNHHLHHPLSSLSSPSFPSTSWVLLGSTLNSVRPFRVHYHLTPSYFSDSSLTTCLLANKLHSVLQKFHILFQFHILAHTIPSTLSILILQAHVWTWLLRSFPWSLSSGLNDIPVFSGALYFPCHRGSRLCILLECGCSFTCLYSLFTLSFVIANAVTNWIAL